MIKGEISIKLSQMHPIFYHIRIEQKRLSRLIRNLKDQHKFATTISKNQLPFTCKKHQSLLRRKLGNSDPKLQENKIVNLKLASEKIDGVIIKPNQTFSFWSLVGRTTETKGYIEGMQLSRGEVKTGIGGGICALANLLYWLALHTPLEVIERHHHSFDPFPDSGRVLPFGSGASVFYNYIDLRFHNPTDQSFQINVWLSDRHLKGAILTDKEWPFSYHIEERNHQFLKEKGKNFRKNEIWRKTIDKGSGNIIKSELMISNHSEVKYDMVADMQIEG